MIQPPVLTPMAPMQFAPSVSLADQLKQLGATGRPMAKAAGTALSAPPAGPAPMDISPGATNAGANVAQPGIMAALKGLSPQAILDQLRAMSAGGQSVAAGLPGSAALDGAGMLAPPLGVPDTGNRGVADLVSEQQAAQQARENAARRLSQGVLGRGTATMNAPLLPLIPGG